MKIHPREYINLILILKQELVALAGYAARVSEMLDVFKDAALCKYKRNIVTSSPSRALLNGNAQQPADKIIEFANGTPVIKGKLNNSNRYIISQQNLIKYLINFIIIFNLSNFFMLLKVNYIINYNN